ncbi:aldose epimerase family protein [Acholeplasma granularum]|uniref:aldose epimerase family protein n=1 Tax=Acholeplasma granularum TaxID=264635 RepID=UPI00046F5230|nr:aldose epimerase family protein [Acholeplasma granularum]
MKIYEIKNDYHQLKLLEHGATIYEWLCFSNKTSIVLNNQDMNIYKDSTKGYFGSTIGRVANRIKNGKFKLNDTDYQLPLNYLNKHTLHGGPLSFNTKTFEVVEHNDLSIKFKYISNHLENNFPGDLIVYVTYTLENESMIMSYDAISNQDTIVNLTNHAHFNLGDETILEHELQMNADRYLEVDSELIPTGKIVKMDIEPLNFITKKKLKEGIIPLQTAQTKGIDHAYLFHNDLPRELTLSFKNRQLKIETSYPGLQVYTVNRKFEQLTKDGKDIPLHGAVAFECQIEPDAINHENFNSVILRKDEKYHHFIKYTIKES